MEIEVREETAADRTAIRETNRLAFGGDDEGALADRLREDGEFIVSLVAVEDGAVIGHLLFSRVTIGRAIAASLAPMAVRPEYQRRGVGSALVRRGLEVCRERGYGIAVVMGHPEYYPRFGFRAEAARALENPFGAGDAWMAMELAPGALAEASGRVEYPRAFEM